MKTIILSFIVVCAFLGWIIYEGRDNPNLIAILVILPIGVIGTLFAVFGKDLFRKSNTTPQLGKGDQI